MGKDNKPQIVTIDGVEHDMTLWDDRQKTILNHVADLDRKLTSTRMQLDQLQVGRDAFFQMLKESLDPQEVGLND
jgi:hypothetical protein